jgi:hypothetical protein
MTTRSINREDTFAAIGWLKVGTGGDVAFADADIDFEALAPRHLPPRAFAVYTAGALKVTSMDGTVDTFADGELSLGVLYPMSIRRAWTTGTTATKMKIFW